MTQESIALSSKAKSIFHAATAATITAVASCSCSYHCLHNTASSYIAPVNSTVTSSVSSALINMVAMAFSIYIRTSIISKIISISVDVIAGYVAHIYFIKCVKVGCLVSLVSPTTANTPAFKSSAPAESTVTAPSTLLIHLQSLALEIFFASIWALGKISVTCVDKYDTAAIKLSPWEFEKMRLQASISELFETWTFLSICLTIWPS